MLSRHQAVEEQALAVGLLVPYLDRDRLAAVRAGCLDAAVDVQRTSGGERRRRDVDVV
ncbi:MAG: hypothetical protein M3P14_02200 [Chloroflexota bacterium]|nr:hypothetical protein [Chloroflexota bacterium]